MTLDSKTPSLLALAKSGKPKELEQKDWESGALERLSELQPECLVPIVGRAEDLRGLLLLGPKLSEEPYSHEDFVCSSRLLCSRRRTGKYLFG